MSIKTVTVLGSTGSVGRSTIDLLLAAPERFRVLALVGNRNAALLAEQARAVGAELAVCARMRPCTPNSRPFWRAAACASPAGRTRCWRRRGWGRTGPWQPSPALPAWPPRLAAAEAGHTVALANKEALVSAGDVMLRAVARAGATLLPVDSEHNAIFQALAGSPRAALDKIVLTASGGPFRLASRQEMAAATPEMALRHPVWSMGAKITIDSATLFNKGLEVIEAARLFDLPSERIEVLVHPQSIVHGMAYFSDGSVLAQLGAPDMRIPIAHALAWPERLATSAPRLDLAAAGRLEFSPPDEVRFPALRLARQALQEGGGAPTILNAANEIAVAAFLARRIGFLDIARVVEAVLNRMGTRPAEDLGQVEELDEQARRYASEVKAHAA